MAGISLATIGSSALSGGLSFLGGERANRANVTQARLNRQFQERMSNTAYQRAVKDMKAAGINPMLAAKVGGASSPGGSLPAPMQNTAAEGVSAAQKSVASAQQAANAALTVQSARKVGYEADRQEILNAAIEKSEIADTVGNVTAAAKPVIKKTSKQVQKAIKSLSKKGGEASNTAKGMYQIIAEEEGYLQSVLDFYTPKRSFLQTLKDRRNKLRKNRKRRK